MFPVAIATTRGLSSMAVLLFRTVIFLLPAVLLTIGALRAEGNPAAILWGGVGVEVLLCLVFAFPNHARRRPVGSSITLLYLVALAWIWAWVGMGNTLVDAWFSHLSQFVLVVVPLGVFGLQMLTDSGAFISRRANLLSQRLSTRQEWPADLEACKSLPEVKALREALVLDASPALGLLQHARPQVRIAALAALEFRTEWRTGQAEMVLRFAREASEPILRAAALTALANVEERTIMEAVAEFLRDPAPEVRRAATEAILWDTERRWFWVRAAVRVALADPVTVHDGPLVKAGAAMLKPEVVTDLCAWAAEKGIVGVRAATTLAAHYDSLLHAAPDSPLIETLKRQLSDVHSPPSLRMELAQLLRNHDRLDRSIQEQLLDPQNPAPLRLLAADALLSGPESFAPAIIVLRDIARMPNREMALGTADVVQRRLGIDLGLPLDRELPPLQSRVAAEVTRRLMRWAAQQTNPVAGEDTGHVPPDTKLDRPNNGSGYFPTVGSSSR
jgi:hypothetical protein